MHGKQFQETLIASKTVNFKGDARVVCERLLNVAVLQHKVKTKEQFAASGISPENNLLFFSIIITMYINSLVTNIIKVKVVIQDTTGHKTYRGHIPLTVNSVHRLNLIK